MKNIKRLQLKRRHCFLDVTEGQNILLALAESKVTIVGTLVTLTSGKCAFHSVMSFVPV